MMQGKNIPQIISLNSRGNAHLIRMLLMAIGQNYEDLFVSKFQDLVEILGNTDLEFSGLPYLIHEGQVLEQNFFILKYCCLHFNSLSFLGTTVQDGIKIAEIFFKHSQENQNLEKKLILETRRIEGKQLQQTDIIKIRQKIGREYVSSKFYKVCCKLFEESGGYLLGYFTILDFAFYEKSCFSYYFTDLHESNPALRYKAYFQTTPFYQKYQQYINHYPFINRDCIPNENIARIVSEVWRQPS